MAALVVKLARCTLKEWLIIIFLAVAIFLRFYNLKNSLMFQGDQGRDAIVVSRIFREGDLVFIGPVTSVGNMYLGPLYHYFDALLMVNIPSHPRAGLCSGVLGVLTVWLTYYLGQKWWAQLRPSSPAAYPPCRQWLSPRAALAGIPIPRLLSLLMVYGVYQAVKTT
jgi:hypothetical protein